MQSSQILISVCHKIEQLMRKFVWGTTNEKQGVSLVGWEEMCQPQKCGGCGFRKLDEQNSAFLSKLAFNIVARPDMLWVKVLRAKYKWCDDSLGKFTTKCCSHLWRSLAKIWEATAVGFLWKPGDGRKVKFWYDNWVGELGPLKNISFADIPEDEQRKPIRDYITPDGQWDWSNFAHLLPANSLLQISKITPPKDDDGEASCTWQFTSRNNFTVSSAYKLHSSQLWEAEDTKWDTIWKWPGAHKVKTFLWLAMKKKLLTNQERYRRHMSSFTHCEHCCDPVEDIDHILRHCPFAKTTWLLLIPHHLLTDFFSTPFDTWMLHNISGRYSSQTWSIVFGIMCWKLWEARNKRIFTEEHSPSERIACEVRAISFHTATAMKVIQLITDAH